jgi:hypothetical protein
MFTIEYLLSGDRQAAESAVQAALEAEGFEIKHEPNGEWKASHGSIAKTMFLGAFTGSKNQRLVFTVTFAEKDGNQQVTLHRSIFQAGVGDQDGIEMLRLTELYEKTELSIKDRLTATGMLAGANI